MRIYLSLVVISITAVACGGTDPPPEEDAQRFPDVIEVKVVETGKRVYRFDVTISSPYDSPERYADAWRVTDAEGTVYGLRELLHDHGSEQPFTRSLSEVEIPVEVSTVTVQGRDLLNGWGGGTVTVDIP